MEWLHVRVVRSSQKALAKKNSIKSLQLLLLLLLPQSCQTMEELALGLQNYRRLVQDLFRSLCSPWQLLILKSPLVVNLHVYWTETNNTVQLIHLCCSRAKLWTVWTPSSAVAQQTTSHTDDAMFAWICDVTFVRRESNEPCMML